jgi:hypothetical protein
MAKNVRMMAASPFRATDLDNGPFTLTISGVSEEEFDDGKRKPSLSFEETPKNLILNRTNLNIVCDLFGDQDVDMIGQKIQLYQSKTRFRGSLVPCVSVRKPE